MPGATIMPSASISSAAVWPSRCAMVTTFPSLMPTSMRRRGRPVPSTTKPLRMMRSYSATVTRSPSSEGERVLSSALGLRPGRSGPTHCACSWSLHAREGGLTVAHDEELEAVGAGHEPVGLIGGHDRHVLGLHGLAIEHAAAFEHHEDLGVVVAVHGGVEVGGDANDLCVEPAVALG